jgi:hypothetical protein
MELRTASKNVIPAEAGIQKLLPLLDSRLRGSDELIVIGYRYSSRIRYRVDSNRNPDS